MPEINPRQVRATAEYLARLVGCVVVDQAHHVDIARLRRLVGDEDVDAQWRSCSRSYAIARAEEHYATAERLRIDRAAMWELLKRAVRESRAVSEEVMAEWGEESARQQAVIERQRQLLGPESFDPQWASLDRFGAIGAVRQLNLRMTAAVRERDRLRQELDLAAERTSNPRMAEALRTLGEVLDTVKSLIATPVTAGPRRSCPCRSQCDYLDGEDRCSDTCNCAAGRRWVAGDPEPEIGVTVRRTSVADYYQSWTRMPNGSWHPNHACRHEHADQCSGLMFAEWKQLPRPLVEVVNTGG